MNVPTAIIAEDEPVLRGELKEMLAAQWPELDVRAEVGDGPAAIRAVGEHAPSILFLDIEMPGMNGLEVARRVSGTCHVVFVTAYDKYAVAAFEQGAVDYVMKPFSAARLDATIARLKSRLTGPPADLTGILKTLASTLSQRKDYLRWITAAQGDALRLITVEEICYFRADHKYTLVVTPDSEALIRRPAESARRGSRPAGVLADPPLSNGQREGDRRRQPRLPRPSHGQAEAAQGNPAGGRELRPPVQADVAVPRLHGPDSLLNRGRSSHAATSPLAPRLDFPGRDGSGLSSRAPR
jgi:DNA-binding LytR/AlgR family response regulator